MHNAQNFGFSGESLESESGVYYYLVRAGKALYFALPPGCSAEEAKMEHKLAQRRMLVCAAFFSFGTLCGAQILFDLIEASFERIFALTWAVLRQHTALVVPISFLLFPIILILSGVSAVGRMRIAFVTFLAGCTSGFLSALSVRYSNELIISAVVFLVFALCLLMISVNMAGISARIHAQLRYGGLVYPDYRYFSARVECAVSVILLEAAMIAYYILRL